MKPHLLITTFLTFALCQLHTLAWAETATVILQPSSSLTVMKKSTPGGTPVYTNNGAERKVGGWPVDPNDPNGSYYYYNTSYHFDLPSHVALGSITSISFSMAVQPISHPGYPNPGGDIYMVPNNCSVMTDLRAATVCMVPGIQYGTEPIEFTTRSYYQGNPTDLYSAAGFNITIAGETGEGLLSNATLTLTFTTTAINTICCPEVSWCNPFQPAQLTGSVPANTTGISYAWYSSPNNSAWTPIANSNSVNYTPGPITASTYYRRTIIDATTNTTIYSNSVSKSIQTAQNIVYLCNNYGNGTIIKANQQIVAGTGAIGCTSGITTISDGATVKIRAGQEISLNAGFSTGTNTEFEAAIGAPCDPNYSWRQETDELAGEVASADLSFHDPSNVAAEEVIDIYPNPNRGSFNIKKSSRSTIENIKVISMLGDDYSRSASLGSNGEVQLDAPSGSYWVIVQVDGKMVKKLLVML